MSLYDTSNVPKTESTSAAQITTAGIIHNLKVSFKLEDGNYKDQVKNPGKWYAFTVTLTDASGCELKESYFRPPFNEDQVAFTVKKYGISDGKTVELGECTKQETIQKLNNEFLAFLIDLGSAMGYPEADVTRYLVSIAKEVSDPEQGFITLCNQFIKKYRPSQNTKISAKLLWENNKKKETSYLKMHGSWMVYQPYGNDRFDVCKEGRPTLLTLSQYEMSNGMKKLYTNEKMDAPSASDGAVYQNRSGMQGVQHDNGPLPF